jgi:hypothetical protein
MDLCGFDAFLVPEGHAIVHVMDVVPGQRKWIVIWSLKQVKLKVTAIEVPSEKLHRPNFR